MQNQNKGNPYGWVTDVIVAALNEGKIPWRQPWFGSQLAPRNLVSNKPYRGINALLLACLTYESPYYLTYKQATERGGYVKKGEKGHTVVFYCLWNIPGQFDKNGKQKRMPLLRCYKVFNVTQCEGVEYPKPEPRTTVINPIEKAETIWDSWNHPSIVAGNQACYSRRDDIITMPGRQLFDTAEGYYATLFHEAVHSTGHETRINRDLTGRFGDKSYSFEELIAEIGSAYLCGHIGIANKIIDNARAYCQTWAKRLKADEKMIVRAAGQAQKAADYILGTTTTEDNETDETVTETANC